MNRQKKLLLIGDYFPDIGGVTFYVHKLLTALARLGFGIVLFQTRRGKSVDYGVVYIRRLPAEFIRRLQAIFRGLVYISAILRFVPFTLVKLGSFFWLLELVGEVDNIVRETRPIVIHSNHLSLRSLAASIVARRFSIPVIVTSHGYDSEPPPSVYEYLLRRAVVSLADVVIALTKTKRRILVSLYGNDSKIVVVPNFVECNNIVDNVNTVEDLKRLKLSKRGEYGISSDKLVLLYLGRIEREKGVFDIINAIDEICNTDKSVCTKLEVIIAGTGSAEEELKSLLSKKNIPVKFVGKIIGNSKNNLLLVSNILLFPTYLPETFPTVVLEAYSFGIPVVAYSFRGINEFVLHNVTGIVLLQRDYHVLAKTIVEISKNVETHREFGLNALRYVSQFCERNVIPRIVHVYYIAYKISRVNQDVKRH